MPPQSRPTTTITLGLFGEKKPNPEEKLKTLRTTPHLWMETELRQRMNVSSTRVSCMNVSDMSVSGAKVSYVNPTDLGSSERGAGEKETLSRQSRKRCQGRRRPTRTPHACCKSPRSTLRCKSPQQQGLLRRARAPHFDCAASNSHKLHTFAPHNTSTPHAEMRARTAREG